MRSINDATFESCVLQSKKLVLVDFWAGWCQPCMHLIPVLEKLELHFENVAFFKMNVDENETPANFQVRSLPSLFLLKMVS